MANDEHKRVLFEGPNAWNTWRKTNPKVKPDLSEIDISGFSKNIGTLLSMHDGIMKIRGYDFSNVNFRSVNLSKQQFACCNFAKADLRDANMQDAHFYKVLFSVPSGDLYKKMDIHGRINEIDAEDARAYQCSFENAYAYNTTFEVSSLNYCDLTKINLDESTQFKRVGVIGTKLSIDQLETLDNLGGLSSRRIVAPSRSVWVTA